MARGGMENLVQAIAGDDDAEEQKWDYWMKESEKKLLVIDIHKSWCGPCQVMNPTFRRIFLDTDDADQRLQFLSADSSKISALAERNENPSCKPFFQVYSNGASVGEITGANAPSLQTLILENMPALPGDDDA